MNFLSLSGTCFKQSVIIIITNSNHFCQSDPPLYLRGLIELTGSNLLSLSFLSILLPFIYLTSYFYSLFSSPFDISSWMGVNFSLLLMMIRC